MSGKYSAFWQSFLVEPLKNEFTCQYEHFGAEEFYLKVSATISDIEPKSFVFLSKRSTELSKPHSSCPYEIFVDFVSKKVVKIFFQIRTMSEELSPFCRSFSDGVAKIAFYVTLAIFSVDMIFLDKCFFRHFRKLIEIISAIFWDSSGLALVTAFYISWETLWGQVIFLTKFYIC